MLQTADYVVQLAYLDFSVELLQILQILQWTCVVEKIEFWQQIRVLTGMSLGKPRHP